MAAGSTSLWGPGAQGAGCSDSCQEETVRHWTRKHQTGDARGSAEQASSAQDRAGGGDPLAERRHERRGVPTFRMAAEEVHATHSKAFKNDKHRKQWLSSLAGVFSAFGPKRVDAIASADVLAALASNWLRRPETSRRVLQRVRTVFDWCKAQGFRAGDNPTEGLTKVLPKHRRPPVHHPALPFQHVPPFVQTLLQSPMRPKQRGSRSSSQFFMRLARLKRSTPRGTRSTSNAGRGRFLAPA